MVVVGYSVLDVDVMGEIERFCPDAPVPVVDFEAEQRRPGGAALAAYLAAGEADDVVLVTGLGADEDGAEIAHFLKGRLDVVPLRLNGATPKKTRLRSAGQTLLRLDAGDGRCTTGALSRHVELALKAASAVLVADYGRGLAGHPGIRSLLAELASRVPVVWDPHPRGSAPIPNARLVTPNDSEAAAAAPEIGVGRTPLAAASQRADALVRRWSAAGVAVTMGKRGALLSVGEGAPLVAPAPRVEGDDTCGAGDQFAASATVALARGRLPSEAVVDGVRAASEFVRAGGAVGVGAALEPSGRTAGPSTPPIRDGSRSTASDVVAHARACGGTVVATGGCFDLLHAGHVSVLNAARALGDCLVVCVNSDQSVRRLKGRGRPVVPQPDRVRILEALECVDAVLVFEDDTPAAVLDRLRPDVWVKGGDYAADDMPEAAVVEQWGGQVVRLPYAAGRSTTQLVRQLRSAASDALD
jgi:rfaE bifunctional protein nucleotidyltransferase chain/domain